MTNWLDKIATAIADTVEATVDAIEKGGAAALESVEEEFKPLPPSTNDKNPYSQPGASTRPVKRNLTSNELSDLERFQVIYSQVKTVQTGELLMDTEILDVGAYAGLIVQGFFLPGANIITTGPPAIRFETRISNPFNPGTKPPSMVLCFRGQRGSAQDGVAFGFMASFGKTPIRGRLPQFATFESGPAFCRNLGHWPSIPARLRCTWIDNGPTYQAQINIIGNIL